MWLIETQEKCKIFSFWSLPRPGGLLDDFTGRKMILGCGKTFLTENFCHLKPWNDSTSYKESNKKKSEIAWKTEKYIAVHNVVNAHSCSRVTGQNHFFKGPCPSLHNEGTTRSVLLMEADWKLFISSSIAGLIFCQGNGKKCFLVCYSFDILSVWTTHWSFWQPVGTFLESRHKLFSPSLELSN